MFKFPSPSFAPPDGNGMDEAVAAFDAELQPTAPKGVKPSPVKTDNGPVEQIFGGSDSIDGDDDDAEDSGEEGEENLDDDKDTYDEEGEGDGEEDEGDDEEGEEDEEEGDEEGKPGLDLSAVVQVTIDGAPAEVTVEEAVNGYIRQETFHQRLNKLAEVREVLTKEAIDVDALRKNYVESVTALQEQLAAIAPKEPDWNALKAQDPAAAWETKQAWDTYKAQLAALDESKAKAIQESSEHTAKQTALYIAAEKQKMAKNNPDWSDAKVMHRDLSSMRRTAKNAGYSDEEIDTLFDSRQVTILKKASKYDRLMAKKPKPAQRDNAGKPSTVGSGSSSTRTVPKHVNAASKRLLKTGSVKDAASVFHQVISR